MYLLSSFIYYRCEVIPFYFRFYNENSEREEGERKKAGSAFISLDNMGLNGNFNMTIFSLYPARYSERGRTAVKALNIYY